MFLNLDWQMSDTSISSAPQEMGKNHCHFLASIANAISNEVKEHLEFQ